MSQQQVVLVLGAGDATGDAVAKRFARAGYIACLVRRDASALTPLLHEIEANSGVAHAFGADVSQEADVLRLFDTVERDVAPIGVVVFNAGADCFSTIDKTSVSEFRRLWETNTLGGFLVVREAARRMAPRRFGTIIITGATGSLRGAKGWSAFAASKSGLRALTQSAARELGPAGIHVAHVIIDGVIDTPRLRERAASLIEQKGEDGIIDPHAIAETYWQIHCQPSNAWTFELDLRPAVEPW